MTDMRDRPEAVMLFAAGFGTRMGRLTADRPKPMIEVAGKPLVDHALDLVRAHGANRMVINLHYRAAQLERHLEGAGIAFSHEQPEILDTGGGLRAALPLLGSGPVFTMNTDAIWRGPNPLDQLLRIWAPDRMDALLLCIRKSKAHGHVGEGDFQMNQSGLARRGPGLVYSGLQIIRTDLLHEITDTRFSLNLVWDRILARDRLFVTPYPGEWCDVGSLDGIGKAENMLGYHDV